MIVCVEGGVRVWVCLHSTVLPPLLHVGTVVAPVVGIIIRCNAKYRGYYSPHLCENALTVFCDESVLIQLTFSGACHRNKSREEFYSYITFLTPSPPNLP